MNYDKIHLSELVKKFGECRLAVVGDLMLDVYILGTATRISPEAPVPIVRVNTRNSCLGGAANVMRNIATMGGSVHAFGVVGADANGREIAGQLRGYGVNPEGVYEDSARPTTEKQRIMAGTQQLLRIDFEETGKVSGTYRDLIIEKLSTLIRNKQIDGIIFDDYAKGMLSEDILEQIIPLAQSNGVFTALDPKPGHLKPVKGLSVMKPNRSEAFAMAGLVFRDHGIPPEKDEQLHEVAERLMADWEPECLVISLAAQGLALFRRNHSMLTIPTRAQEVFDVSGAGDTVIAALTLGLAAGADIASAAQIANFAAGIVVGRVGTQTVSADEVIERIVNGGC